jgi:hypothetical protein
MAGVSLGKARRAGQTEKSIWVFVRDLGKKINVPKSVIHDDSEVWERDDGKEGNLVVEGSSWWAREKGYSDE